MQNTKIYLPLFWGFYESIHDFQDDFIIDDFIDSVKNDYGYYSISMEDAKKMKESNWDYSLVRDIFEKYYEIDYCQYRIDYSIEYTDVFKDYFDYILKELGVKEFSFIGIFSPKFYNYGSDEIEIAISYDFKKMLSYIKKHKGEFSEYIQENNTSYDGFNAYGENDFDSYIQKAISKGGSFEPFEITQIIDFVITCIEEPENEEIVMDLHYKTSENIYSSNYILEINKK